MLRVVGAQIEIKFVLAKTAVGVHRVGVAVVTREGWLGAVGCADVKDVPRPVEDYGLRVVRFVGECCRHSRVPGVVRTSAYDTHVALQSVSET